MFFFEVPITGDIYITTSDYQTVITETVYRVDDTAYVKMVVTGVSPIKDITLNTMSAVLIENQIETSIDIVVNDAPIAAVADLAAGETYYNIENELYHEFTFHRNFFTSNILIRIVPRSLLSFYK